MGAPLTRRSFLKHGTAAGLAAAYTASPVSAMAAALQPARGAGSLLAGAGVADVTPPLGDTLFGYVRPDRLANGVAVRLWSRALVLSDGATRFVLVTMDLGAALDKADVVDRVADLGFGMDNVVLAATHTHAGPETWTEWLEGRIAASIRRADADLGPARAGWARGTVRDVNTNRSLSAHLANHGFDNPPYTSDLSMDPEGPDHPRDLNLRLLRVERPDGTPVAAWSNFPVHPTNFPNTNTLYSADLSGIAMLRFEDSFPTRRPGTPPGTGAPLGMLANGNEGDLMSLYEAYNPHSCADLMGLRLATAMRDLWDRAGGSLSSDLPLASRWTRIGFLGQEVEPGKRVASRAEWGYPMLGGAENGPSPFFATGTEGTRLPAELADPVHGRKIRGYLAPWRNDPELQVVRIGSVALVPVAGEATTEAGRRITAAVLDAAPEGVDDATVVGLANDYVGYFTTPEEYEQQHYEGGHTVFGTYTTLVVIQGARDLTAAIAADEPAPEPVTGQPFSYPPDAGAGTAPGAGADSATVEAEPACDVARMDVVGLKWRGGPDGLDRPVDGPFVLIERHERGAWHPFDSDLGVGFFWSAGGQPSPWAEGAGSSLEEGLYAAQWEVPADAPLGTYRYRVTAARYELTSAAWAVSPSDALVVRGVEHVDGRLVFRAQHPAPDPEVHLRFREPSPSGGRLSFTAAGRPRRATWDAASGGWVAPTGGLTEGDTVEVPDRGLVDGHGNTSGPAVSLTVGEVADLAWPPDMAVGGTDRDWHGHTPAEIAVDRGADCPGPTGGAAPDDGGDDDGPRGGHGPTTPATGGGAVAGGTAALLAAQGLRRAYARDMDASRLRADASHAVRAVHAGAVPYATAWDWQRELVRRRAADEIGDVLLTLEHPRVYTLGKRASRGNVLLSDAQLAERGIETYDVDRGGDVTYHGPGQLVAYPILRLADAKTIVPYVRALEEVGIRTAASYGIEAGRLDGFSGVWVGRDKLMAIGVRVTADRVTEHGLALNVTTDLADFDGIVPCGITDKGVCSLSSLGVDTSVGEAVARLRQAFGDVFDAPVGQADLATLDLATVLQ